MDMFQTLHKYLLNTTNFSSLEFKLPKLIPLLSISKYNIFEKNYILIFRINSQIELIRARKNIDYVVSDREHTNHYNIINFCEYLFINEKMIEQFFYNII